MELNKIRQEHRIALLSAMLEGQEHERSRLARDLYDGLGGLLSSIKLELSGSTILFKETAEQQLIHKTMHRLDDAVNELRRLAQSMMPEILMRYGLGEAMREYCRKFGNSGAVIQCQVYHYANEMDHSRQVVLYRIMQELVNNALRHARASLVFVQLQQVERTITLTVEDDGDGFDPVMPAKKSSAGLGNVRAQAAFLNATLDICSEKGSGTTVTVECADKVI